MNRETGEQPAGDPGAEEALAPRQHHQAAGGPVRPADREAALVFELMDMNIYELIRGRRHYVAEDRVKSYMYQLIKSMDHMHRNGIFHRDIKPENILIMDDVLKLADFGSCRGIYSKQPYTEYISTRWYRAPECLLTDGYYNYKMDMWGVGCVFFEIVSLFPLFPGTNELDQIQKIHNIIGTPAPELLAKMKRRSQHMDFNFPPKEGTGIEKLIPHVNPECVELITKLLAYNPDDRLSARQALRHPYFKEIRDQEKRAAAKQSPDLSASNGTLNLPPPTGDSTASSDGRRMKDGQLPSIAGGSKTRIHAHAANKQQHGSNESGDHHGGTLPQIGSGVAHSEGSEADHGNNLPPISVNKGQTGRKAVQGNYTTSSNHSNANARNKQRGAVANKHRTGASNTGKYKKYGAGHP
eukprot:CAMPEP_0177599674 /NCGR_PEP_ID=MMETSP0419_2-20121207/13129_1 /TAXON_ID=582737 /ORGANISM="Tetraselmis sp., Strain GSL018" /LENGTH=410 /DNA_ID=CAMNT_0019092443 /DNA_START=457 /DNA_END=1690 /DNA_ORIENTATION=-